MLSSKIVFTTTLCTLLLAIGGTAYLTTNVQDTPVPISFAKNTNHNLSLEDWNRLAKAK